MSTEPESQRSGGVDLNAQGEVNVGGDVVGRDKNIITQDNRTALFAIAGIVIVAVAALLVLALSRPPDAQAPTAVSTRPPSTTPFSGKIHFTSSTGYTDSLGINLAWEPGNSTRSRFASSSDTLNLTAGPQTWPFFPSVRYSVPLEGNFDIQAKVVLTSPFVTLPTAQMAGIMVRPAGARLVAGASSFPPDWVVVAESITDAGRLVGCRGSWDDYPAESVYLRIERKAGTWHCAYSADGEHWTWLAPTMDNELLNNQPLEIALFAYSDTDDMLSVEFSDWIISQK
jgi:hypothetical protein